MGTSIALSAGNTRYLYSACNTFWRFSLTSSSSHLFFLGQPQPYNVSQGSPVDGMLPGACDKILNYISTEMREEILQRAYYFLSEVFLPEEIAKVVRDWEVLLAPAHATDPNYPAGKVSRHLHHFELFLLCF